MNRSDLPPPSRTRLPAGDWRTVLDGLCARFPAIPRAAWASRFARGLVTTLDGTPLAADAPHRAGLALRYYREVASEPQVAARERIVHADAELVVVDKPHGLPVAPVGAYVHETLLARLARARGDHALAPLHRLDRATAGLVLLSANPATRAAYHALFRERRIVKIYRALAPPLPALEFPHVRRSRIVRGTPFFRSAEVAGEPNAQTTIDVLERRGDLWLYELRPLSGRKHQLRLHMAALGAAIAGDTWYPEVAPRGGAHADAAADGSAPTGAPAEEPPLRLVAHRLEFTDPIDGSARVYTSAFAP